MKFKGTPWIVVFSLAVLVGGIYLSRIFSHHEVPVNFGQKIDEFKSHGVPDFQLFPFGPPEQAFKDQASKPLRLSEMNQKVIIINFWATWCVPCVTEFPSLVALSKLYRNDSRFKIIAIAINSSPKDIEKFLSQNAAEPDSTNFVVLLDPDNKVAPTYGTEKIPETYIINEKHLLLTKVIDQQNWVSPEFLGVLRKWL